MKAKAAIHGLQAQLNKKIDDALTHEVFDKVVEDQGKIIYDEVYAMPTSGRYQRRWDDGGLLDPDNTVIVGGAASGGVMEIENITRPNPYLNGVDPSGGMSSTPEGTTTPKLIEYGISSSTGYGYDWWDGKPRPFVEATRKHLRETKVHVRALKKGLQRQGVKVKNIKEV